MKELTNKYILTPIHANYKEKNHKIHLTIRTCTITSYVTLSSGTTWDIPHYYPTAANTVQITVQIYRDIVQLFVQ